MVGEEGVFLTPAGIYYPTAGEEMSVYRMSVALPIPYECVTQGHRSQRFETEDTVWTVWEAMHPSDGINLVAGKYEVKEYPHNDVMIYTYLFPEDSRFGGMYVPVIKEYLDVYCDRIGPYPYSKFALVENFFETGYGMPGYTVLGSGVMSRAFIMHVSLPHEILHNWWGNGVFVDYDQGNWCEGLTTYMSNYYIKEREGPDQARDYRRNVCRDYASYVDQVEDYPLSQFVARMEAGDRAIGYGKAMMVFHDLRLMVGDDSFYEALRFVFREKLFQKATWADFQKAFEWVSGEDLEWYFEQWIEKKGAPQLSLGEVRYELDGPMYRVTAELIQAPPVFRLQVPVVVATKKDRFRSSFGISQERQIITLQVDSPPLTLDVDPDFDVFRRLNAGELPPTVARVYGDKSLLVVMPSKAPDALISAYESAAGLLTRTGDAEKIKDTDINPSVIAEHSFFLLGAPGENSAYGQLKAKQGYGYELLPTGFTIDGQNYEDPDVAAAVVTDHPERVDKIVAFLYGKTPEAIDNAIRKLPHYGKYSWVTFRGVERWDRGTWEVIQSPLKYTFR